LELAQSCRALHSRRWHRWLREKGGKGKWECVRPNEDPRRYVLDWNRGEYYETLYLKKHGKKISGYDQFGHHVWGVRIEA